MLILPIDRILKYFYGITMRFTINGAFYIVTDAIRIRYRSLATNGLNFPGLGSKTISSVLQGRSQGGPGVPVTPPL